MNKNSLMLIIAFISTLTSVTFIVLNNYIVASAVGIMVYMSWAFVTKAISHKWQFYSFFVAALIAGYAMGLKGAPPFLAVSLLCFSIMLGGRTLFFERLAHTDIGWLEPIFYSLGCGFYIAGNLLYSNGWMGWVFPLPLVIFNSFMVMSIGRDYKGLKARIGKRNAELGKPAPGFTLPDTENNPVSLSDYKNKRHVLLIFVRGDWCPTCHIMLRTYEKYKEKFAEKNIMLLAIGPDSIGVNHEMVVKLGIDYKMLCDDKAHAAKAYGMMFQSNNNMTKYGDGIPLPASFLVDINGTLLYTSDPHRPGAILTPDTIFPVIEGLGATA
ncbi:MAG TPA: peroxiredoxin family protein [Bacteroidia bacterium]|nr:peroxiredoxin family protein [Bacteroidia bacterium]